MPLEFKLSASSLSQAGNDLGAETPTLIKIPPSEADDQGTTKSARKLREKSEREEEAVEKDPTKRKSQQALANIKNRSLCHFMKRQSNRNMLMENGLIAGPQEG
jgi:transcription initiation factor TFIID subunit TAF12